MINKRIINTGAEAAPAAFDPLQNFETVTYTGNGSTQKITGYIRKGAAFNGSSSTIGESSLRVQTSNGFSFWFNTSYTSRQCFFMLGNGSNADGAELISNTSLNVYFNQGAYYKSYTISSVSDGNWHHLVVTNNSTTSRDVYLDGSLLTASSEGSTGGTRTGTGLLIGNLFGSPSYYLNGKVDQFRIFNKALSSGEVTTLYNETYASSTKSTTDIFGDGSGVALYELDEDASDTGGTYNGTPTNVNFLGMAFQPDLVWIKNRTDVVDHKIFDSIRGATNVIESSTTDAEVSSSGSLTSFDSNGFTVSTNNSVNGSGDDMVAWCFKGGGTAVSNTDGTIASSVSANQDAGFSIVKGTAISSGAFTVGHGLSQAPEFYVIKNTSGTGGWIVYTATTGAGQYLVLNDSASAASSTLFWNNTAPSSTVFTMNAGQVITGGADFIAYCFHSVDGYQKVGSYSGSNSPITITTGFQPRFLMIKRTDTSGSWVIIDSTREIGSAADALFPDLSVAESSGWNTDFISTGFTISSNEAWVSVSGGTYIYLAIA